MAKLPNLYVLIFDIDIDIYNVPKRQNFDGNSSRFYPLSCHLTYRIWGTAAQSDVSSFVRYHKLSDPGEAISLQTCLHQESTEQCDIVIATENNCKRRNEILRSLEMVERKGEGGRKRGRERERWGEGGRRKGEREGERERKSIILVNGRTSVCHPGYIVIVDLHGLSRSSSGRKGGSRHWCGLNTDAHANGSTGRRLAGCAIGESRSSSGRKGGSRRWCGLNADAHANGGCERRLAGCGSGESLANCRCGGR